MLCSFRIQLWQSKSVKVTFLAQVYQCELQANKAGSTRGRTLVFSIKDHLSSVQAVL